MRNRDSSVVIATGYTGSTAGVHIPEELRDFLYFTASRPALGPTQPPIQWVPRALSRL
jgi:hypothetical protein